MTIYREVAKRNSSYIWDIIGKIKKQEHISINCETQQVKWCHRRLTRSIVCSKKKERDSSASRIKRDKLLHFRGLSCVLYVIDWMFASCVACFGGMVCVSRFSPVVVVFPIPSRSFVSSLYKSRVYLNRLTRIWWSPKNFTQKLNIFSRHELLVVLSS